ncbi:sugar phosphate isomerase/epimerase [Candidatus Poribacteria bacterium]|nr:sugar phosphate isomerase/epimerase [Candidatus Poribacteria bacterium]
MKPSIWTDAFVEFEPEEAIERLREAGWRYFELADKHWRDIDKREKPEEGFRNLKRQCERLGVLIHQMHGPMFNTCEEPSKLKAHMEEAERSLRWAGVLGVRWVVFHPGSASISEDEEDLEEVRRRNLEVFGKLADTARQLQIGIAIENTADRNDGGRRVFGATTYELLSLVRALGPEVAGICWDTGHANVQKLNQYKAIKALGKHLVATHIDDNNSSSDQHLLPFEGNIDWKGVMRALREVNYDGFFNLEIGGAMHKVPLSVRVEKARYALELTKALIEGRF